MRVSGWPCLSRPQPSVAVVDALGRRRGMLSTEHLSLSGLWTYTMRWDTTSAHTDHGLRGSLKGTHILRLAVLRQNRQLTLKLPTGSDFNWPGPGAQSAASYDG
jgi:hypothetical protein